MARKMKSGIFGLNALIHGGINEHSVTVVVGSSGAGKTMFAKQFLHWGLQAGQEGIYITLDESPEQILNEAAEMGWEDARDYVKQEKLVFIDASGKQITDFIKKELADFVAEWQGAKARIVIDPLTPVLWSSQTKYDQRDLVSYLMLDQEDGHRALHPRGARHRRGPLDARDHHPDVHLGRGHPPALPRQ